MFFNPLMPFAEQISGLDLDYGEFIHERVKHLCLGFFVKMANGKKRGQVGSKHDLHQNLSMSLLKVTP